MQKSFLISKKPTISERFIFVNKFKEIASSATDARNTYLFLSCSNLAEFFLKSLIRFSLSVSKWPKGVPSSMASLSFYSFLFKGGSELIFFSDVSVESSLLTWRLLYCPLNAISELCGLFTFFAASTK